MVDDSDKYDPLSLLAEVTVEFDTMDVVVHEEDGVAEVCLTIDNTNLGELLVVEVTTGEKTGPGDNAEGKHVIPLQLIHPLIRC